MILGYNQWLIIRIHRSLSVWNWVGNNWNTWSLQIHTSIFIHFCMLIGSLYNLKQPQTKHLIVKSGPTKQSHVAPRVPGKPSRILLCSSGSGTPCGCSHHLSLWWRGILDIPAIQQEESHSSGSREDTGKNLQPHSKPTNWPLYLLQSSLMSHCHHRTF